MFHLSPRLTASRLQRVSWLSFKPPLSTWKLDNFGYHGVDQGYQQINWDIPGYRISRVSNLWSWASWYRRNSDGVNILALSSSSAGRKPASIASATDIELADPCAGIGKCDSREARSRRPVDGLLRPYSISSWQGLASMFSSSCSSGPDCAEGGSALSRQAHENLQIPWYPWLFWDM